MAKPLQRVQLKSRHWIVRNGKGDLMEEVAGEGVVGAHPVLYAGRDLGDWSAGTAQTGGHPAALSSQTSRKQDRSSADRQPLQSTLCNPVLLRFCLNCAGVRRALQRQESSRNALQKQGLPNADSRTIQRPSLTNV